MSNEYDPVYIGTSGYQYPHWRGRFYPDDLPKKKWLETYATSFDTVEINNTFYGLPKLETVEEWRQTVPRGFRFALKFSRYGSHTKCLKNPEQTVSAFMECVHQLKSAAGPVLVQLKPDWHCNPERLEHFLKALPPSVRWAFEFRDASWFCDEVYGLLKEHNAAMVIHDMLDDHPDVDTADWSYHRFHGDHYKGHYTPQFLSAFADRLAERSRGGREQFIYFNNDAEACAVQDALNLKRYLSKRTKSA
jgi:uncharacterized protein YecE (DUF72 family)